MGLWHREQRPVLLKLSKFSKLLLLKTIYKLIFLNFILSFSRPDVLVVYYKDVI